MKGRHTINTNAFALTFYFFSTHNTKVKKIKRECKPTHTTVQGQVQT